MPTLAATFPDFKTGWPWSIFPQRNGQRGDAAFSESIKIWERAQLLIKAG